MAGQDKWVPPKQGRDDFNCPRCGVYAHQEWSGGADLFPKPKQISGRAFVKEEIGFSFCARCKEKAVWVISRHWPVWGGGDATLTGCLVYPEAQVVEDANEDLADDIKKDHNEAASILSRSPKSAAALLRMATEKLCQQLVGEDGEKASLAENIEKLKEKGMLEPSIVDMMETLRLAGNNAVHPGGFFDDEDNHAIATKLFGLINQIAKEAITIPRERKQLHDQVKEQDASSRKNKTAPAGAAERDLNRVDPKVDRPIPPLPKDD